MKWLELWAMLEVIGAILGILLFIVYIIFILIMNRK